MKPSLTIALSSIAHLPAFQAIRAPVQLENLQQKNIKPHGIKLANTTHAQKTNLTVRIEAPPEPSSTISFANPAAQGMRSPSFGKKYACC